MIWGPKMAKNNTSSVTIADVAKNAGVSTATAGRVLGRYGSVKENTKERVLSVAKDLGYSPNEVARGLRSRRTKFIAVVVGSISNNFFGNVINAIEREAYGRGYNVIICNSHEDIETEQMQLKSLQGRMVDGIIISSAYTLAEMDRNDDWTLYKSDVPMLFIDRRVEKAKGNIIESNNFGGGYKATKYLIDLGHRCIGVIGTGGYSTISERIRGYRQALEESGIPYDKRIVAAILMGDEYKAAAAARAFMETNGDMTACMVLNNSLCMPLLLYLDEKGKRIPNDLSLISWDDSNMNKLLGITTVAQFPDRIGARAARCLIDMIEGKTHLTGRNTGFVETIDVDFIVRSSCRKRI